MYSPSTHSWVYISDLPTPRSLTTAAVLSSTEILAVGGWCGGRVVKVVYQGTLHLKLRLVFINFVMQILLLDHW